MEKVTLFFVNHSVRSSSRQVQVPKPLLGLGFLVFVLCLAATLVSSVSLAQFAFNRIRVARAQFENTSLNDKLTFYQKLTSEIDDSMHRIFSFDDKIRMLYGLKAVDKDIREVGVGGPDFSLRDNSPVTIFDDSKNRELSQLKIKIEKLLRQTEFEMGSIGETHKKVVQTQKRLRRYPSILPAFGRITSGFGYRIHPIERRSMYHQGIDIANKRWTPVYATADGVVHFVDYLQYFGNLIVLRHGFGFDTYYGHLAAAAVKQGQFVMRGDLIGYIGRSGRTTGPHLHYEIRLHGKPNDPMRFISPVASVFNQFD